MALIPKISFPIPANGRGKAFANTEELLGLVNGESSGLYLVGSQGMWHGGIHITDTTAPWCALTGTNESELAYVNTPYPGEQAVSCMADGEVVAWRVSKDYDFIEWRGGKVYFSTSFVLVRHYIQPGENASNGLIFHTLYMNLAPVSAYGQTDASLRQTAKGQSYYTSQEAVNAGTASGTLAVDTQVTLGAIVMTSTYHHRQFCEVTVVNGTGSLNAGDKVWTVSDRGWLKPLSGQAKVPSWWAKCSPAYHAGTGGLQGYKTGAALKAYLSEEDVSAGKDCGKLPAGFPVAIDSGIPAFTRTTDNRVFSLVTLGRDNNEMKNGDRVWVVSDNDNLVAVSASSAGTEKYGEVVVPPTPVGISAGDSIGHLGFYELPEENGKHSRYQVHIECLSADSKLPAFLTNPDHVGETDPAYLSYSEGAALFMPDAQGRMVDSTRKSRAPGILTRSKVPGVDADGQLLTDNLSAAYYQVRPEGGWMAAASVKKVAQYDLASLGFITLDKAPESFDLIDGIHHPDNVVKGILTQLCTAAQNETDSSRAMNQYNYERLLKQIDTNNDGQYSEQEYLQAVHNPSYRDHLYRIIVKHPSEWYYGKDDEYWKTYLDTLTEDPSLVVWKTYTEAFIEKMKWMQQKKEVTGMVGEPWHMHPVAFLGALIDDDEMALKWLTVPKGQLTFDAEGNDQDSSPWFSRKIHWPGGVSGVTIGRGYDLGQQTAASADLGSVGISGSLATWLVGSQGLTASDAHTRFNSAPEEIRAANISRKKQYDLFMLAYIRLEDDVKRISQKPSTLQAYHPNPEITPDQAWNGIPEKIKEVLVDLRYRGDYTTHARLLLQRYAYTGDLNSFGQVLSDRNNWLNVPEDRFNKRIEFYEN